MEDNDTFPEDVVKSVVGTGQEQPRPGEKFHPYQSAEGWFVKASGTFIPSDQFAAPIPPELLDQLPPLSTRFVTGRHRDLFLTHVIGKGGMGVVRSAKQVAFDREVAVKTTGEGDLEAHAGLLREAWITGALQHPNIVPVHLIGRDPEGHPMMVMKRIEGTSWRHIIHDPSRPEIADEPDPLDWHLKVLTQVCNAIEYAHANEILHRDLKTENVMIGSFGQVYVLDWGVAVSKQDERGGRFPVLRDIKALTGTPNYMAPEMVAGKPETLDERTDVYLLGAMLHEVLTRKFRHEGTDFEEVVTRALLSPPYRYDSDVPEELAAICNRACHRDRDARYPDVRSFREALGAFMVHRQARELALAAAASLRKLQSVIHNSDWSNPEVGAKIQGLFGACRFGFQQALKTWDEFGEAREGLATALEVMISYAIKRRDADQARALYLELGRPRPDLKARIDELEVDLTQDRSKIAQLRQLERDLDVSVGARARRTTTLLLGVGLASVHVTLGLLAHLELFVAGYLTYILIGALAVVGVGVGVYVRRERLLANVANRRMVAAAIVGSLLLLSLWPFAKALNLYFHQAVSLQLVGLAVMVFFAAVLIGPRLWTAGLAFTAAAVATLLLPEYAYDAMGLGFLAALSLTAFASTEEAPAERSPQQPLLG